MKQYIKISLTIIAGMMILSSCSKTNKQGKLIPKNAMAIVDINVKSLTSKLSWDDIKQTAWFKKLQSDSSHPAWAKNLLDSPANSGIDLKSDIVIFFAKTPANETQVVVEGDVKDAKAFEDFNKKLHPGATASKDGDLNFLSMNNKGVVGWNSDKFVYVFNSHFNKMMNRNGFGDTTINMAPVAPDGAALLASCKNIFALKSDSSLAKDEKFSALVDEDGDIHYWQNAESMMSGSPQLGMLSMLKLDVFLKGNITTATASFDDGKITVKHRMYTGKELTDLLKKYGGGSIDNDMIKNIPSLNVAGVMALHFKPEGIKELIKLTGMDGMVNMGASQFGISMDDFVAANKGDIMVAITDPVIKNDSAGIIFTNIPHVNFVFAAAIGDKNAFDKLINAGKKISGETHTDTALHYAKNDKYFAISNNQDFANKYIAGTNNKFDFLDKISGHAVGAFVDINKILQTFTGITTDSTAKVLLNQSIGMWSNIYSTGGDFKDDAFTSTTEINLVDKTTNSLKQLNKYLDGVSKLMMEKHKKQMQTSNTDSTTVMAPPIDNLIDSNTPKNSKH